MLSATKNEIKHPPPPIVGIGASAGGLEAFSHLIQHLDPTTGMAFVLIQHLDPTHQSSLSVILSEKTKMPVLEVVHDVLVLPNHIYVVPPSSRMILSGDRLKLISRQKNEKRHFIIDEFFNSLASERNGAAIGVILSGNGTDGSKGVQSILAEGGVTYAQDCDTAKFSEMPTAAAESGADFVLSPQGIASELLRLSQYRSQETEDGYNESQDGKAIPHNFNRVFAILRAKRGMDLNHYKKPTVQRRISRRMTFRNIESIEEYAQVLRKEPDELDKLYDDILIKVTSFFRTPESFVALKKHVFPIILKNSFANSVIRIWVPGCSTGEEAYSIAISAFEFMEEHSQFRKIEIFATDISDIALNQARQGTFDKRIEENITVDRLNRFFTKEGSTYRVIPEIRDCCIFAKQNLAKDPPFSNVDLISCRNVLIYLIPEIQRRVLSTFRFALNTTGYLIVGNSETIPSDFKSFSVVDNKNKIFSKDLTEKDSHPDFLDYPFVKVDVDSKVNARNSHIAKKINLRTDAEKAILKEHAWPGVIVNEKMEIMQFRGDTSDFLMNPPGEITANLLKMCRSGLLADLRAALYEAELHGNRVKRKSWVQKENDKSTAFSIDIIPFRATLTDRRHYAVLFTSRTVSEEDEASHQPPSDNKAYDRLKIELEKTKEYLNAIIEKERSANEELKSASEEILSANEELRSTNEEISSTKEEIQATNEELMTVNAELQNRNVEIGRINSDLSNLFSASQIPLMILTEELVIRQFTPAAEKVLNLSPSDMGHTLDDVAKKLNVDGLQEIARSVIKSLNTVEKEILDGKNRWHNLLVKPYRTLDNKIEGVVVALIDIDDLKRTIDRVQEAFDYADSIVQTSPTPLVVLDNDLCVLAANQAFLTHFELEKSVVESQKIYDLDGGGWRSKELQNLLEVSLQKDEKVENFIVKMSLSQLGECFLQCSAKRLVLGSKEETRILLAIQDVTKERKIEEVTLKAKEIAETANQTKSSFLANMSHEIRTPLAAILGYVEILANPNQPSSMAATSIARIRKNVEHLTGLVDGILDISKIEAGKLEIERVTFKLLPELSEIFASLAIAASSKGLCFNVEFLTGIPESIESCPQRLKQILNNVVSNAIKFTEQGNIKIVISFESPFTENVSDHLSFVVSDTGIGLSDQQQRKLFEPFKQADCTVTRRFGGSGLGLALARKLAQALGGDVRLIKSQLGAGTSFVIDISTGSKAGLSMLENLTSETLDQYKDPKPSWFENNEKILGLRVLLVEDSEDIQALMRHYLEASGAIVKVANNGAEALKFFEVGKQTFDVILMDIQMPILGGYETTQKLRNMDIQTPIVALTAHVMKGEREKCISFGCDDYIGKPVKPKVLVNMVAKISKSKENSLTKEL